MKFADDCLTELKAGDILIYAGDPDSDFYTHKAEYEVHQDEQGLYVIDDQGEGEELNKVSAMYFVVKEPDAAALRSQLERYKNWVTDLQSGMYVNCVYCGHQYGPSYKVPASMADVLKQHIEHCPEHPMSKLRAELELTKKALFLSCVDHSDHCCPDNFSDLVVWEKCATCPAKQPEARYDIERDANCWRDYYIEKAENQAKEAK